MVVTATRLKIDPEFRDLIPPLSEDELKGLEEDIKADGCRDPLDVWDGTIVDGHNRFEICTRLKIPYKTNPIKFMCRTDAISWIIRKQIHRRNLPAPVRMELAKKLKPTIEAKAKENERKGGGDKKPGLQNLANPVEEPIDTRATIAKEAGVSPETFRKHEKIMESSDEKVKSDYMAGNISNDKAYRQISGKGEDAKPKKRKNQFESIEEKSPKENKLLEVLAELRTMVLEEKKRGWKTTAKIEVVQSLEGILHIAKN